jgi:hypothetical protein
MSEPAQPPSADDRSNASHASADTVQDPETRAASTSQNEIVDASGADSFPASDPPSWWGGS